MGIHQVRRKPAEPVQVQALPETGFFTYQQASKYLRLPVARLRILQRAGKLNRIPGTHAHLFAKEELDRFRREQTANGNGQPVAEDSTIAEEAKQAGRAAVKNGDIRPPWEQQFERLRNGRGK